MSEAVATSAAELIGGIPSPKKQRSPWPADVPYTPHYPGAGFARHPVDKAFISRADALALGAKDAPVESPKPATAPEPTPAPAPQPEPQPIPTGPKPEPGPQAKPAPDFSDLPPGDNSGPAPGAKSEQQQEPTQEQMFTAYQQMAMMFWDSIIRLLAVLFGDFWLPRTPDERKMVVDALVGWMHWIGMRAFSPLENLWMAIGLYCMPRVPQTFQKISAWFKGRKKKRKSDEPIEVETETVSAPGN